MVFFSFDQLQELWSFWEVRGIILFSLFLQSFLILVSPFRTKIASGVISRLLWLAYLLADAAATFAVGLIAHSQGDTSVDKTNGELLALWAPILMIHLGGPDTITALALEDNELWQRHLLQLLSQLAATLYVLYKLLTRDSKLLVPTILVLVVGIVKYGERVYSLYLASGDQFRDSLLKKPDPGDNYARNMRQDEHTVEEPEREFVLSDTDEDRSDIEMVEDGYKCYTKFKGLVADLIYSNEDWQETRKYFSKRNPEQAFRVVEIELNFLYEALYTKMPVVHNWFAVRIYSFVFVVVSFFLWYSIDKSHIPRHDVKITYALLGGAITLDVIAFFMPAYSDWLIVSIMKQNKSTSRYQLKRPIERWLANYERNYRYLLKRQMERHLAISERRWSGYSKSNRTALSKLLSQIFCFWRSSAAEAKAEREERTIPLLVIASRIFCRRWSESVQQFNIKDYCGNARSAPVEKVCGWVGLTDFLDRVQYVSIRWFSESLRDSIFSELKAKSDTVRKPGDVYKICEARGQWVLENELSSSFIYWRFLKSLLIDVQFDKSIILWHIATEICYSHDIQKQVEEEDDDASKQNLPASWQEENEIEQQKGGPESLRQENDIEHQKGSETDQEEEEGDGQQQKGTKTDLKEEDDAEKQKGLVSLEKEDDVEQQLSSSEIQEYQGNAAKQQEGDETMEEKKGHVMQQNVHEIVELKEDIDAKKKRSPESTPAANEKDDVERQQNNPAKEKVSQQKIDREVAKTLSDYMLYLLIMQPKIMTTVAGISRFRFRTLCNDSIKEAKAFLQSFVWDKNKGDEVNIAFSMLLKLDTDVPPANARGDRSKSLMFEGSRLAQELDDKLGVDKWNVIHKVWVEMLCYAATHCSGNTHGAQLSKGGQLITFVWLLMVHLGLGKQFEMNEYGIKSTTYAS